MQQLIALTLMLIFAEPFVTCGKGNDFSSCLPKDARLKSIVQEENASVAIGSKAKLKTLEDKLIQLKARCAKGKLVDPRGKEVRIVHLIGCWGNPPEDYQEQLDRQQTELKRLKEKYVVIEIPCEQNKLIAD